MISFTAELKNVCLYPHIVLPEKVVEYMLSKAEYTCNRILVKVKIKSCDFDSTVIKSNNNWILYLSKTFCDKIGIKIFEKVDVNIEFLVKPDRKIMHKKLKKALDENIIAKLNFKRLSLTRKKEMIRYINNPLVSWKVDVMINDLINRLNNRKLH
jgi:hypothetical protein